MSLGLLRILTGRLAPGAGDNPPDEGPPRPGDPDPVPKKKGGKNSPNVSNETTGIA